MYSTIFSAIFADAASINLPSNEAAPCPAFAASSKAIKILNKYVISIIDHKVLNDIDGLENPTSEHLSKWIWDKIINKIPTLSKIVLSEDHGTGIIYKGE